MRKYLLLFFSLYISISLSAQCLGDDCSIKGRNKAAQKKAAKMTGNKRAGRSYAGKGRKTKRPGSGGFDPFAGGGSKKSNAGGFDPFAAADKKKKKGKGGGYDPFASGNKKRKGSSKGYDPFASNGKSKKGKGGGGYDPFAGGGKRKGVAKSSAYDGWDSGTRRSGSRGGEANDSWARSKKPSSTGGGGIWAMGDEKRSGGSRRSSGGGGSNWFNNDASTGMAPPAYDREDNTPKSWSDFDGAASNYSSDISYYDRPRQYKFSLIAGQILEHSNIVSNYLDTASLRPVLGAEFAVEFPTTGGKNWHHYFNMPVWGLGFTYLNLGNNDLLGHAFAIYPYIDIPLVRTKAIDFNFTNGFGVAGVTNFDKSSPDNPDLQNPLIGSPINMFIKTGLSFNYRPVTQIRNERQEKWSHYTISAGVSLLHLSNGSFSSPNAGINMLAAQVGIKHTPMDFTQALRQQVDNIPHYFTLDVMGTAGVREMYRLDTKKYLVGNFNLASYFQVANIYRLGAGLDAFYDEAFADEHGDPNDRYHDAGGKLIYDPEPMSSRIRGGLFLSNEFVLGRTTAALDAGFYVYDNIKQNDEKFYYRLALKYRFTDHFFGAVAVKAHTTGAEFVSAGVGYSIPLY
ncbi:MAG: acyloxyacyl hydrolase [Prevotellaceae bacterium]|jgi:hypothetical protein|nr:acyloxyacyl hydrolase [Prevotellaceae bacterium]